MRPVVAAEWRPRKFDRRARWSDPTHEEVEMIDGGRDRLADHAADAGIDAWLEGSR